MPLNRGFVFGFSRCDWVDWKFSRRGRSLSYYRSGTSLECPGRKLPSGVGMRQWRQRCRQMSRETTPQFRTVLPLQIETKFLTHNPKFSPRDTPRLAGLLLLVTQLVARGDTRLAVRAISRAGTPPRHTGIRFDPPAEMNYVSCVSPEPHAIVMDRVYGNFTFSASD